MEDYLKTKVELKRFERKLDFWNLFENWSLELTSVKNMNTGVKSKCE